MTTRRDAAEHAAFRIDREPGFALAAEKIGPGAAVLPALREQKPGKAKGQSRLADAARPAEQYCVGQPAHAVKALELALGALMADEMRVRPRRRRRALRFSRRLYRAGHRGRGLRSTKGRCRCMRPLRR